MTTLRYYSVVILLLCVPFIGHAQSDGNYCADVFRYNPSTLKESYYTLVVEVQESRLVRMYWPNGGFSDKSDFPTPRISSGKASFSDYDGVQFTISLTKRGDDCFDGELMQCSGLTLKGHRCRNKTGDETGKCHFHR